MQSPVRLGVTLMILCVVAAGLLAFTSEQTAPVIAKNDQAKLEAALKELLPDAEKFEATEEDGKTFYQGFKGEKEVGVVAVFPQKGFGGFMKLMLGVSSEGKVTGFRVLEHSETPGLGARITESKFQEQFVGKSTSDSFQIGKDVQAISGATISSRSVAGGIKLVAGEIEKKFLTKGQAEVDLKQVPDGEYKGEANGFEGPIRVSVKVSGGKIVDIQIIEQNETPEVGGKALPELTQRFVQKQSLSIDNVSGATFTSEGVKAAVNNALAQFAAAGPVAALDLNKVADGTYKGQAGGFGGDISVEVTVKSGKITDIKVDAPQETPEIGGAAVKKLAEEVKAQQKLDVDTVSGATFSSQGFLDALQNAFKSAGAGAAGTAAAGPVDLSKVADGTYKGQAGGFGGDISVEVTVKGGKITDIKVDAPQETPEIGGAAVKELVEAVKAQQKLDVDTVSGATFSSKGFLDALQNAFKG